MKVLNQVIFAALMGSSLVLVACGSSGGGGGGGTTSADPNAAGAAGYATTPQPCNSTPSNPNCLQGGYYNGYYQQGYRYGQATLPQSWYYGAWQFPSQWQPQVGNCGCQSGYQLVYHASYGMACAPQAYFNPQNFNSGYGYGGYNTGAGFSWRSSGIFVGFQFNWGASYGPSVNNQNLNIPQTQYGNYCNANTQAVRGCDTRDRYSCGSSQRYICQPAGGGTSIGICVDNYYGYSL